MPTLTRQTGATSDEAYRILYGDYWAWPCDALYVGDNLPAGSYKQRGIGMRFSNITLAQGAVVSSAYLTFRALNNNSGSNVNSRISAEKIDDAGAFVNNKVTFDARWANRTTARVDWDDIAPWTNGQDYNSPEIKTVVQEILDRAGWGSGNDMVIFWEDFEDRSILNSGFRRATPYNASTTLCPILTIVTGTSVTVATNAATSITQNSAQLNGTLTNAGAEVAYVSFDWGLTATYGNSTLEEAKLSSGAFNKNIGNNLTADTTYHFRAVARVGSDYVYGSDLTFRTGTPSGFPVRVTNIVHLFSAGPEPVYKAEVFIGGLQSSYLPPISDKEPLPSIPVKTDYEALKRLGMLRTGTAMSQTNALFQYGVWLSQHTQAEINAIFKHQPTFAEWWAWYQVYGI